MSFKHNETGSFIYTSKKIVVITEYLVQIPLSDREKLRNLGFGLVDLLSFPLDQIGTAGVKGKILSTTMNSSSIWSAP